MVDVGKWLTDESDINDTKSGLFAAGDKSKPVPLRSRFMLAQTWQCVVLCTRSQPRSDISYTFTIKFNQCAWVQMRGRTSA